MGSLLISLRELELTTSIRKESLLTSSKEMIKLRANQLMLSKVPTLKARAKLLTSLSTQLKEDAD